MVTKNIEKRNKTDLEKTDEVVERIINTLCWDMLRSIPISSYLECVSKLELRLEILKESYRE